MKNVIILGGSGYIGTHLAENWLKQDESVNIISLARRKPQHLNTYLTKSSRIQWIEEDVLDPDAYIEELPQKVSAIVDLVGGSKENTKEELYRLNVEPLKVMLKLMDKLSIPKGCYISAVRGLPGRLGKSFTRSKREAEAIANKSGKNITILRPSFVYGSRSGVSALVRVLKITGVFYKPMKPVTIDVLAKQIIRAMK